MSQVEVLQTALDMANARAERWKVRSDEWAIRAVRAEVATERVRALIPTENPELIEAGYPVSACDLLAALDGDS